ncbi:MAG: hypothetical protein ACR2JM_02890 [Mycobacterium sp.]
MPEEETPDEQAPAESQDDQDRSRMTRFGTVGLALVVVLAALFAGQAYRVYRDRQNEQQRAMFLEVGRQAAINLTTIDYQRADSDVQRVLDSATGAFKDEFSGRSDAFIDVVTKAQSKSSGSVTEAGIESMDEHEAQVMVALAVKTTTMGVTDPSPRYWRMRLTVSKTDGGAKISKVDFVS